MKMMRISAKVPVHLVQEVFRVMPGPVLVAVVEVGLIDAELRKVDCFQVLLT